MDTFSNLGIEWTSMLFYVTSILVLILILSYLLYKPVLKFIDKRRQKIIDSIEEAKNLQKTFEEKLEESDKQRAKTEETLKEEIENLKKFTEKKRAELTKEMDEARVTMMAKAEKEIAERKESLIKEAEGELKEIMVKIVLDIVENQVPEEVIENSINSAWKQYK